MDTLSFILGIAFVVVIAVAVVAVYAFVKVKEVKKQIENNEILLSREIEIIHRNNHEDIQSIYRRIDEGEKNIFSQMDSRFDKLISKKQLLKS